MCLDWDVTQRKISGSDRTGRLDGITKRLVPDSRQVRLTWGTF